MKKPSERRLVENEMVFRQLNEQVQKGVDEVNRMAEETGQSEFRIMQDKVASRLHFYCECSNVNCVDRVIMSYQTYKDLHKRRDHFIVVPGHEVYEVERLVQQERDYSVVEKYMLPPEEVTAISANSNVM
jgi:hypothetical protein